MSYSTQRPLNFILWETKIFTAPNQFESQNWWRGMYCQLLEANLTSYSIVPEDYMGIFVNINDFTLSCHADCQNALYL